MRALPPQKILAHGWTRIHEIKRKNRKCFAPIMFVRMIVIQETHFPGFKIQLDAIMTQAVQSENSHDGTTRTS